MKQLRIPGPTPCPEAVLQAVAQPMINHRGPQFQALMERVTTRLKEFFNTKNDLYVLTGSGTGGMETAVVNHLSPGDKVLAITNGYFGERFAGIAEAFGAQVVRLEFPWGEAAQPQALKAALEKDREIKAVVVVHNETSTGLTNPLRGLAQVVRASDRLLIVDAVSSLGALELPMDEWGVDVLVTGSQKGWMVPPGLAMIAVSPRAWQYHTQARMPRYYWDLSKARRFLEKGQTPWTPAISIFYGLDSALEMMAREGQANIIARHRRVADLVRGRVKSLGLKLFPDEKFASNTVTCIRAPEGVEVKGMLKYLREEEGITLAGGQGMLEGKTFRIGHLGWVDEKDGEVVMKGVEKALARAGYVRAG